MLYALYALPPATATSDMCQQGQAVAQIPERSLAKHRQDIAKLMSA
jgi:hypothetical protein